MKPRTLNVPDEYLPLIITALEHHHASMRAIQREDAHYEQAADWFKRKRSAASEEPEFPSKRKKA